MKELNVSNKVILISPPYMQLSFPSYDMPLALTKGCNYMNPGLLIASSILKENNISCSILKVNDIDDFSKINNCLSDETVLVGISCTCAWEYLESLAIAKKIKKTNENVKIVISGWQIKSIGSKVFDDTPYVDYIIIGDAEYTILELYNKIINNDDRTIFSVIGREDVKKEISKSIFPKIDFKQIDFSNFPEYEKYLPYVEESRNCPYNCEFCLNSCVNDRYQNVPFNIFCKNVENIESLYGKDTQANLLAANFGVDKVKTKEKLEYLKDKKIKWNIELHVDNPWEYYINDLKAAGINKASIGFESGSPTTLSLMNKTKDPYRYLERLKLLLLELKKAEISVSLNLLIDYRETEETLIETLTFLEGNKHLFKKVKANFMFAFDGLYKNIDFHNNLNVILDDYGKKIHAFPILPQNFSLAEIGDIINEIEKGNFNHSILKKYKKKI